MDLLVPVSGPVRGLVSDPDPSVRATGQSASARGLGQFQGSARVLAMCHAAHRPLPRRRHRRKRRAQCSCRRANKHYEKRIAISARCRPSASPSCSRAARENLDSLNTRQKDASRRLPRIAEERTNKWSSRFLLNRRLPFGNPAIFSQSLKTGGFASPLHSGFALMSSPSGLEPAH